MENLLKEPILNRVFIFIWNETENYWEIRLIDRN